MQGDFRNFILQLSYTYQDPQLYRKTQRKISCDGRAYSKKILTLPPPWAALYISR